MRRGERGELRQRVEELHRAHPEWTARTIESVIAERSPVLHGDWVEETARLDARLRSIQRWRGGGRMVPGGPLAGGAFPLVWPVGERQRQDLDPVYTPSKVPRAGSTRLFLYNCGPEVVRDVRIVLDDIPVGYAPSLPVGRFCEILWMRIESLRMAGMAEVPGEPTEHVLRADFAVGKGMHEGRLIGQLGFEPLQGWRLFQAGGGRSTEIE